MFSKFFQRLQQSRLEQRFHKHFTQAAGSPLQRNAIAVAMMELEEPALSDVTKHFSADQRPIFLTAYQTFVVWVILHIVRPQSSSTELQDLAESLRAKCATFPYHSVAAFNSIWPHMDELMPIALRGGAETKVVYPLPHIIQAAIFAGYQLPMIVDHEFGIHVLNVMHRIATTLQPEA